MGELSLVPWLLMAQWAYYFPASSYSLPPPTGNLGCLFSESVCQEDQVCRDDGVFGRCRQIYDSPPFRYELDEEELGRLTQQMEDLLAEGYKWHHPRTQCLLQTLLSSFLTGREFDEVQCDSLKDADPAGEDQQPTSQDANGDVAYIRYKPSDDQPDTEFADEVYSPPGLPDLIPEAGKEAVEVRGIDVIRRSPPPLEFAPQELESELLLEPPSSDPDLIAVPRSLEPNLLGETRSFDPDLLMEPRSSDPDLLTEPRSLGPNLLSEPNPLNSDLLVEPRSFNSDLRELMVESSELSDLLDELDEWSFQRSERLDVKKPGPHFSTNNYAFQDTSTRKVDEDDKAATKPTGSPVRQGQKETVPLDLPNHPPKAKVEGRTLWFQSVPLADAHKKGFKSSLYATHFSSPYSSPSKNSIIDTDQYDIVDTTFTYIEFKDSIQTWKEGTQIVKTVARLLHVPPDIFTHQRIDRNEVTFKVIEPNSMGWNASQVAKQIDGIKDELKKEIGVVVTSVGVGDKNKLPTVVKLEEREEQAYVVMVIVCGVLAALGLSAGVLYLTRRHGNKLTNMTSSDTEPSKHYQELCRARMSSKNGSEGNTAAAPHRVASLSRESDNSPSSRSSTSSWSEEPALSNMDVATGQLVLNYMDEHLKNKERLESEWAALCAYSPDPCATTVSLKEENLPKNRSESALPYDHARVVLNELSNISGSDYINASTITDHDPRNPAYIVTQGPLPTTTPDFWQMVWEQGCVVIVMLTRLVENDTVMCHRYWPAEGSELYHIFEVHLVSEHIWCDDYLVRSFYLKNMKTGETRTVTQFHFLCWPQASVPQSTKPLLEFRRKVNKSFRGRSCPIVVHCSDGVGRSGTYCLLDMVLNRMAKGAKEIDVAATLEHVRDQRAGALATAQQFRFVLSAVSDELHAILKLHPQANP